jgi:rare lipoprotein A
MATRYGLTIALAMALVFGGCARKKRTVAVTPPPLPPAGAAPIGWTETGIASWYGHPYHGRRSASGEVYDMEKLTAAHRTLPFHTWVRVDPGNGKSVEVRINDRGPFIDGRIIDLSRAAARAIDLIGPGVAPVRIQVIRAPEGPETPRFAVQAGAFQDRNNAERLRRELAGLFGEARLVLRDGDPPVWRVLVGTETDMHSAGALAERVRAAGGKARAAFVVRLDL